MRTHLSILITSLTLMSGTAIAHEFQAGELYIDHPWARALPPIAPTGAAYLSIENRGDATDRLLSATTALAEKTEIHEHVHQDGLMKMQQVHSLSIEPGQTVQLQPGGYHVMLFNLRAPLQAGESFPLMLQFERAGEVEVTVNIEAEAPTGKASGHGDHSHH